MSAPKTVVSVLSTPRTHWVGDGFPVRTVFAAHSQDPATISPFLLLDYAGPKEFPPEPPGKARGVDEHPHRGFETVTIVFQGELEHRDSSGNSGKIGPGDVQWMTAAAGVVHEEKHSREFTQRGGTFEVAQLWVNLPSGEKMAKPRYQEILGESIPRVELPQGAGSVRIIAGEFAGQRGPAHTVTPINLWDMQLKAGGHTTFALPEGTNTLVLLARGRVSVGEETVLDGYDCAVMSRDGASMSIHAIEDSAMLLLNGQPIAEPVVAHGPFVMNTAAEIQQAKLDYQNGRMGHLEPIAG
jgi:hypothetical protein